MFSFGKKSLALVIVASVALTGTGLAYAGSASSTATPHTAAPSLFGTPSSTTLVTPAGASKKAARSHHKGTQFKHLSKTKKLSKHKKHTVSRHKHK